MRAGIVAIATASTNCLRDSRILGSCKAPLPSSPRRQVIATPTGHVHRPDTSIRARTPERLHSGRVDTRSALGTRPQVTAEYHGKVHDFEGRAKLRPHRRPQSPPLGVESPLFFRRRPPAPVPGGPSPERLDRPRGERERRPDRLPGATPPRARPTGDDRYPPRGRSASPPRAPAGSTGSLAFDGRIDRRGLMPGSGNRAREGTDRHPGARSEPTREDAMTLDTSYRLCRRARSFPRSRGPRCSGTTGPRPECLVMIKPIEVVTNRSHSNRR
jgi:hypothetical protein